jgi:hypothetical protein
MRVADRPTVSAWRKALALAIALAVAVGVWFSLGGWLFADVSPPPAEAAQQTSKSSDQDVPGPLEWTPSEPVLQRTEAGAPSDFSVVPKEAAPVREMLRAVRDHDLIALRNLYSAAVQQLIQKKGWGKYADDMVAIMTQHFGGVDPTAYGYSFLGNGERGVVKLYRSDHGAAPSEMRVVCVGDRWLLDEW